MVLFEFPPVRLSLPGPPLSVTGMSETPLASKELVPSPESADTDVTPVHV